MLATSCATYKPQYTEGQRYAPTPSSSIQHTVYLIGDVGGAPEGESTIPLLQLTSALASDERPDDRTDVVFLGDNIYPVGLPPVGHTDRPLAEHRLDAQLEAVRSFGGNVTFIPGNHDWYKYGRAGLQRQERYIEDYLSKYGETFTDYFRPSEGCGEIATYSMASNLTMVSIDSHWFLTDQGETGDVTGCTITSREEMIAALADTMSHYHDRSVLLTMHHPLYTVGEHGGRYTWDLHVFPLLRYAPWLYVPLPGVGSIINAIKPKTSPQDSKSSAYKEYRKAIVPSVQQHGNTIVAAGHEHTLQHNLVDGIHYIVSGSGSKRSPSRAAGYSQFVYGGYGYVLVDYYEDGKIQLQYFAEQKGRFDCMYSTVIP